MKKNKEYNPLFIYALYGFISGVLLFSFHYWSVFSSTQIDISLSNLRHLHSQSPVHWIFDILPFAGLVLGFLVYDFKLKKDQYLDEKLNAYEEQNKKAIEISGEISKAMPTSPVNRENKLMESLSDLQLSIRKNIQTEKQREEEGRKRAWITEGMARFSSILRENNEKPEELAYNLISELVKYLEANQGGFFITETAKSGEKYLNMLACYAYDRRKFADKKISFSEGLIGSVAMERKSLYLVDIPDKYLEITSGLGKANPRFLLLTPMIYNDDVKGIIEIASFTGIEKYKFDFMEQVAEIIAMTLENIQHTLRTEQLLKETRLQAEKLTFQEEKVRQNMEELRLTQHHAAIQAEKFISFSTTVNHTLIRAEYDVNGVLLYANTKFIRKLGYTGNRDVEGKHISMFIDEKDRKWFDNIWESLAHGGAHFEGYMKHLAKNGQELWTMATYTCMRKDDGSVEKVLFLAIDTTEQKKQSLDYESQIEALDKLNVKAEFSPDGKLQTANTLFTNAFKYPAAALESKTIFDFLDRKDIENFSESWKKMIQGQAFQSQIRMITKFQEEKWFRANFTSVNDMYGEVSKVIFLGNEITNEKLMENESRIQTEFLKKREEKFRLENLSLNRKLQEIKEKNSKQKDYYELMLSSFKQLIENEEGMSIIFDNIGKIIYLAESLKSFFGIDKKSKPENTAELLQSIKGKQKSEFIMRLFDPAKPKNFSGKIVKLYNTENKEVTFNFHIKVREFEEKRYYLISLIYK
ncbi:MAG: PAS domain-containing protein [Bacteroidota bacterium]